MSYYLDHDGHGDLTLWKGDSTDPAPVAVRHDCDAETWSLLLRGAGLHECQPGTGQVCNVCLGIPSVPSVDPAEECWCHLGIKDVCDVCKHAPPAGAKLRHRAERAEATITTWVEHAERLERDRGLAYRYLTSITTGHALSDHDRRRLHRAIGVLAPEDTEDADPPATDGTVVILRQRGTPGCDAQIERLEDVMRRVLDEHDDCDDPALHLATAAIGALRKEATR